MSTNINFKKHLGIGSAGESISLPSNTSFENTKSIEFDGIDAHLNLQSRTQNFTNFTLSFWIKPSTSVGASFDGIVGQDSSTSEGGILRYVVMDGTFVRVFIGSWTALSSALTLGSWHHIALTYDSSSDVLKGYTDGSLAVTVNSPNFSAASTNAHSFRRIAMRNASLSTCLPGHLDEMAVFSTALNAIQITSIYNNGAPNDLSSLSPVHWWRFGDGDTAPTLTDNGSGSINATMENVTTFSTDVPIGLFNKKSILLDGVDDFVNVPDNSNLSFGNGSTDSPFSISCWFKLESVGATKWLITKRLIPSSSASKYEYLLYIGSSGLVGFQLYDANSVVRRARKSSASIISADTWYNLVATYNGVGGTNADLGIKIYVNGVRVDNASSNNNTYVAMHNTSEPFKIGQSTDGNVDEVAIFNSELSASDVTSIYNSGAPNDLSSLSPLSWWRCGDGDTSPTLTDNGSGGNNGTMENFTAFSTDVPT